jgi:type I restriction enzyme S subunit
VARLPNDSPPGRLTQDTVKLVAKERSAVPWDYLYWLMRTPQYREYCRSRATGTTNLGLSRDDFLSFPAPEPTDKQQSLVSLLHKIEEKIELIRRMNATLEATARAIFKSWFVDFDPVRAKAEGREPVGMTPEVVALFPDSFEDSELGEIPTGWRLGCLGDLCTLKRGHDLPTNTRTAGVVPVVSSSGISGLHSEAKALGPGVVTGRYGTIGKVFFIEADYWPLNTTLYVEDFKESPPRFIFHVLEMVDYSIYTDKAAVPGVNRNHLHQEPCVIPPLIVRNAFTHLIEPMWGQYAANERQSRSLATLRDTLLPKLLSGELRVAEAAGPVTEVLS